MGEDTPYVVVPITTAPLAGTPGWALADTLVVEVRDAEGHPVPGAKVTWSLPQGGKLAVQLADAANPMTGTADDQGRNYAAWTLGLDVGTQEVQAVSGLTGVPVAFRATASALNATGVAVGDDFACTILPDERVACWGANRVGQLGVGDTLSRALPTPVAGMGAALEVAATNFGHVCARDIAGDVWCWGANLLGEAGSSAQPAQLTPIRVPGAAGATAVAVGNRFSCASLAVGGGHCWGTNYRSRMGTGAVPLGGSAYPTPAPIIGGGDFVTLGLDGERGCAVDSNREIWCWGNSTAGEFSPYPANYYNMAIQPVPGYKFTSTAVSLWSVCGVGLGGPAVCFGLNVGLGHDSGPQRTIEPVVVAHGVSFVKIVTDGSRFYGASADGRLYLWGTLDCCSGSGALPGEVPLPIRIIDVAAGTYGYCVIAETGGLYCDPTGDGKDGLEAFPAP